jgi:hypothetical protein
MRRVYEDDHRADEMIRKIDTNHSRTHPKPEPAFRARIRDTSAVWREGHTHTMDIRDY